VRPTMAVQEKNLTVDPTGGAPGRNSRPIGRCWMRLVVQGRADLGSGDTVACSGEHALMAVAGCQGEPRLGASLQAAGPAGARRQ
jgi:hypothetical protein